MATVAYQQDMQTGEISPMDTAESTLSHSDETPSGFSQAVMQSQLLQDSSSVFPNPSTLLMHVPVDDPDPTVFMTPMDVIPMPHLPSGPTTFLADMPPACDPYIGTPNNHNVSTTATYNLAAAASLDSALDHPTVPSLPMGPAGVSVSGLTHSFVPPSTTVVPFLASGAVMSKQEDVSSEAVAESVVAVKEMLADIEQTAKHARVMFQHVDDIVTGTSIDHLNDRISQVTQKFAGLVSISSAFGSTTAYASPLDSPGIPVQEQQESPLSFPSSTMSSASSAMDISGSDQSRKRCASELEERRNVKAPKREPTDDIPLKMPFVGTSTTGELSSTFTTVPVILPAASQSSPRALTPPSFSSQGPFSSVQPLQSTSPYASYASNGPQLMEFSGGLPIPHGSVHPFSATHPTWSEATIPTRHHHSLSTGAIGVPTANPTVANLAEIFTTPSIPLQTLPATSATKTIGSPVGRMSRSGSINGTFSATFSFGNTETRTEPAGLWANNPRATANQVSAQSATSIWGSAIDNSSSSISPSSTSDKISLSAVPSTTHNSPHVEEEEEVLVPDSDDEESANAKGAHHSSDAPSNSASGTDVPLEYRAEVDRIFFEFLNKICSNLEATDSKGEPIHQTLMAKKMQRLDESPDFRPFKFRIQAFTHAFLEELASNGYPEERIPMKKVRNYLWRSQYILRFNEDGKKAKSKGNHIWNIEAKKIGDGKWDFRPFHRKLAGTPPSVAYCGLLWSWSPHIWDPQASWQNIPVEYSSPNLPCWLSWKDDVLSGLPPTDAESCHVTVNAKFTLDGQEGNLSHSFYVTVAPVNSPESPSLARSRRPSLAGDPPRRSTSDSVLFQAVQRTKPRMLPAARPSQADTRVIRVLQSVAQRVTEEAESQFVSASPPKPSDLQDLVKQKHVLDQTVDAFDKAISGENPVESRRLAVAAQNVVIQAAHTVIADRTVAGGGAPMQQTETAAIKSVTVSELSDATQDAIAQAVKMEGTTSTEVDIMVAATSILKLRTVGNSSGTADPMQITVHQPRSQSTGAVPRLTTKNSPYPLSSVSEYV